jgi:replicative DNA helicase
VNAQVEQLAQLYAQRPGSRRETVRVPPQAVSAEQEVLGALMLDPAALGRITLEPEDFYRRDHQLIYRAILELDAAGKPFDAVTVGDHLAARGLAEQADPVYVTALAKDAFTAANVRGHADIVRQKAILRRLIEVGTDVVNSGFEPEGLQAAEILDRAIRDLMALSKSEQSCEFTLQQAARLAWDDAQAAFEAGGKLRGITTGFARMDARLGGFHAGDLVILGARPSMGKTALAVNMALAAAKAGHAVGMVSGEQSAMQIGQRSIALEARVAAERMRNGQFEDEDWPRLSEGMHKLMRRNVRLIDRSAPTLDEVCRTARRWRQEHRIEVLFVDYLQRIRVPRAESRIEEVAEVARGLKTLARDLDIPVVALAQVKAEVDKRTADKRPGLGDIANSDEATREADLIGFLYRDEVYHDDSPHRGIAELNIDKNRHGPTGQFRLRFFAETMMFGDLDESDVPHRARGGGS